MKEGSPSCNKPSGVECDNYFSGNDGGPTRTTATTATPSSHGGTLSSHDGTPCSQMMQQQPSSAEGEGPPRLPTGGDQEGLMPFKRPTSTCGFAPGSRGSGGGGGGCNNTTGAIFSRPETKRRHSRGDSSSSTSGSRHHDLPVVAFHDAYTDMERGRVCMVMEYMDGGTLQDFVTRREVLSEPALAAVARSVLRGLAEMHAQHQIHRDIKPSNILLNRQGRVKISDFGVVREFNQTTSVAQTFTGTLTYMSPERIMESDYSYPSDVWSLGMVSCVIYLGLSPFGKAISKIFATLVTSRFYLHLCTGKTQKWLSVYKAASVFDERQHGKYRIPRTFPCTR